MNKNMRAGYQGKADAMRSLADKLMNHPGSARDVYPSKSSADREQMRPYKKGGLIKKDKKSCKKFAAGGVAKIRHGEATSKGLPKKPKKKSLRGIL